MFINSGACLLCTSDGVCVIVYVQFSSVGANMVWGGGSSLHSGIEFGRSRTGKGSSGGRKKGVSDIPKNVPFAFAINNRNTRRGWCEEWARSG